MAAAGRRWVRVTATAATALIAVAAAAATALIAAAAAAAAAAAVSRRSTHAREKRAPRRLQRIVERRRREGHKAGWSRSPTHARENRPRVTRRCGLCGDLNSRQTWCRSRSDGGGGTHHRVRLGVDVKPDEAEEEERGGGEAVRGEPAVAAA